MKCTNENTQEVVRSIRDAFDTLKGKWRLPILISMVYGPKRFTEIAADVQGISDKILAKELRALEMNQMICRVASEEFSSVVAYGLTEHAKSVQKVMFELKEWGDLHRKQIMGK
jgi:DNA-binding HxlR family transcriptional regulator